METNFSKYLRKAIAYLTYLFVFFLPLQTKFILRSGEINYQEISFYISHGLLILIFVLFVFRQFKEKTFKHFDKAIFYSLAIFSLFSLLSILKAPDKSLGFFHFFILLAALSVFSIVYLGVEKKNYQDAVINKVTLVYVFLSSIFLHSCLAIYQFFTQSAPACKYLGLASHNPADLGESVVETISGRWLRAYGGFDHPNILGGVLAISLILVAYLLAKKKILNGSRQIWSSIFLFVFYFVGLYALFFSFSRAAWIALIVGLLVLLITLICFYDKWVLGRFIALIFFTLVLAGIVALPFQELVSARIEVETRLEQKSINDRYTYLLESRELLKDNFPFGVGIGNYHTALSLADNNKKAVWDYQPVHNFFLLLCSETGLFSLLAFFSFLFFLIKRGRREDFSLALIAALFVLMMLDHWLLSLPFGILFVFLVFALI